MSIFHCYNLIDLIEEKSDAYIGDENTKKIISEFSCLQNLEIETFLKENSLEFAKKRQAITYLVFNDNMSLVGYFALVIKPLVIDVTKLSNTLLKRIKRIGFSSSENTFTTTAYLIAQLGRNFADYEGDKISGSDLLEIANAIIKRLQHDIGGIIEFIEYEYDNDFLYSFYSENGFVSFGTREESSTGKMLGQMFKLI